MVNWIKMPLGDVVNACLIQRIFIVPESGTSNFNIMIQIDGQDGSLLWNTEGGLSLSVAQGIVANIARASGRIAWPPE